MKVMKRDKRGFTLVELMVTLAISSIALAGMYGVYKAQLMSHVTQNAVVDTQQNLRNTFYIMQRTIRMAGFDPARNLRVEEAADGKQRRGIHGRFKELCEDGRLTGACGTGYTNAMSGANAIAFAFNDTASLFDGTQCTTYPLNDLSCVDLEARDIDRHVIGRGLAVDDQRILAAEQVHGHRVEGGPAVVHHRRRAVVLQRAGVVPIRRHRQGVVRVGAEHG